MFPVHSPNVREAGKNYENNHPALEHFFSVKFCHHQRYGSKSG
jgi:hypothetical protein